MSSDVNFSRQEMFLSATMLLFYRKHPVRAIQDIFGITLAPHQRIAIRLLWWGKASNVILLFSRAMGKTFLCALLGLLYCTLYPGLNVIFLGGDGFRQGKLILEEACKIINCELDNQQQTMYLKSLVDRSPTKSPIMKEPDVWSIPFKNRSRIRTAPIGDGNRIRGFRSQINIIDERKDMPKSIRDKVVRPFGILGKNVTSQEQEFTNVNIDAGTLEFEEDDYTMDAENYTRLMEEKNDNYLVIKFEYIDAFREDPNGRHRSEYFGKNYSYWKTPYAMLINKVENELLNGEMDEESWNAEYRCLAKRAIGNVFTYDDVIGVRDYPLMTEDEEVRLLAKLGLENEAVSLRYLRPLVRCDDPVVIGIDIARESANTAFCVVRLGPIAKKPWDHATQTGKSDFCNVIYAYQQKNMTQRETALFIYKLLEWYPNTKLVAMDKRGGGSGVRDELYQVVKDGILNNPILYDPEDDDEGGIAKKVDRSLADGRLHLITYNDEDNTVALTRVKGAVEKKRLLLVRPGRDVDPEVQQAYKFINEIGTEMRIIQTKKTTNWLKIVVGDDSSSKLPGDKVRTKDLWTTLMYAYGEAFWRYLSKNKSKKKINKVAQIPMRIGAAQIN